MYKSPGNGISVWREHSVVNGQSFTGTVNSDYWPDVARGGGPRHAADTADYPNGGPEDSWEQRVCGGVNRGSNIAGGRLV